MGCVYSATNKLNGMLYVGKTRLSLAVRRKRHESDAQKCAASYFHRALRKYGFDAFEWTVLYNDLDDDELVVYERLVIRKLKTKSPNGYNMTDGGEGWPGQVFSDAHRKNLSAAKKGKKLSPQAVANIAKGHIGLKHSSATKEKLRKLGAGRKHTPEARARMSLAQKGRKVSPEAITRLAAFNMGRPGTMLGKKHTPEAKAKMRGRLVTTETRAKMSAAHKRRRERLSLGVQSESVVVL